MTFLTTGFTSTGLILALVRWAPTATEPNPMAYFLSLVVILPASWFFFDKAKSITRIVAYYRILEHIETGQLKPGLFLGWENSLAKFRKDLYKHKHIVADRPRRFSEFKRVLSPLSLHAYWSLAFYTFSALSFLPTFIFMATISKTRPLGDSILFTVSLASLLAIYVMSRNIYRVWRLTVDVHLLMASRIGTDTTPSTPSFRRTNTMRPFSSSHASSNGAEVAVRAPSKYESMTS